MGMKFRLRRLFLVTFVTAAALGITRVLPSATTGQAAYNAFVVLISVYWLGDLIFVCRDEKTISN